MCRCGGVDVGRLLRQARDRARVSQTELARRVDIGRNAISAYEAGRRSPTVSTLDRLLAACGLQARVLLEPLMADVDARVDALSGAAPELDGDAWAKLATSLWDLPGAVQLGFGAPAQRRGPVTWAIDGPTALALHQLAAEPAGLVALDLVVVLDEALRWWMRAVMLKGYDERDATVQDWLDADQERIVGALDGVRYCIAGFVRVRVVDQLPTTVPMALPWWPEPIAVVTVEGVERSSPLYAELLARWRSRRGGDSAVK